MRVDTGMRAGACGQDGVKRRYFQPASFLHLWDKKNMHVRARVCECVCMWM